MGDRALENRIKKLKALEERQKLLDQEIDSLKAEIKKDLEAKGTEELHVGIFIIRSTSVLSNKFDTKRFKEQYGDLYKQFTKQTASRRFTVS